MDEIKKTERLAQDGTWPKFDEASLFQAAVTEAAGAVQVAPEMAITSALGAMATACQGLIDVRLPTNHKGTCD